MKTKQIKKTPSFTKEEIKILVKLGFESYGEKGEVKNYGNKSFWKNYSDPKDDEEDWHMCIDLTAKAGVFKVNYWAWRYPPTEKKIKGFEKLLDYLYDGDFVDAEDWGKEYVASQLTPEGRVLTAKQTKQFKKEFRSNAKFGLSLIYDNIEHLNKLIKSSKGVKLDDLLFSYVYKDVSGQCEFFNYMVEKDLIEESKKEVCLAWVKGYLDKKSKKIVS